jgi:hypothetical protein
MKNYIKTFESFNSGLSADLIYHFDGIYGSEITNEGLISWIKSKFKLTSLQKGFDDVSKKISDDPKVKVELEKFRQKNEAIIKAVDPEDVKKITDLVKGKLGSVEKQIEVEAEKISEAEVTKSFMEKIVSFLKGVLNVGSNLAILFTSIASFYFTGPLSAGTDGMLPFDQFGSIMTIIGGILALIVWVFYTSFQLDKLTN